MVIREYGAEYIKSTYKERKKKKQSTFKIHKKLWKQMTTAATDEILNALLKNDITIYRMKEIISASRKKEKEKLHRHL